MGEIRRFINIQKKALFLIAILGFVSLATIGYYPQESGFISIVGRVNYLRNEYPGLKAKVHITEDGKPYKTFNADSKGRFETKIGFNHVYMFHFSMEYHATSKVEVNTKVPANVFDESSGGVFEFDCDIYELFEEVNYAILKKPLLKIRFYESKNDFKFNEEYTNNMQYDLDGFREQINEMKQRRKEAITQAEKKDQVAQQKAPQKEKKAKAIVFESEKKKPEKENKSGHRNIMDMLNEEEPAEEEVIAVEENEFEDADSILEQSEAISLREDVAPEELESEQIFLEEELDASAYVTLTIKPKRVEIAQVEQPEEEEEEVDLEYTKMKIQELLELTRVEEEAKIREEVKSFNYVAYKQKEKRLSNKEVQNRYLRHMIKTIALAEIYYKKEYYKSHPIDHNNMMPMISSSSTSSWWVDTETTTITYPSDQVKLKKEVYPFGITYYYKGEEEIDEDTYCSELNELTKQEVLCGA